MSHRDDDTPPPTAPLAAATPRQVFNELLRRKLGALTVPDSDDVTTVAETDARRAATDDAARLADLAVTFADAVDATRSGVPYGDAVVVVGDGGTIVAHARDYEDSPVYWQAAVGQVEVVIHGALLMQVLST